MAATVLAVSHYFLLEFYLYWRYTWLDIPMHLLGGMVVALGFVSLPDFFPKLPAKWFSISNTILAVFIVALTWEVFEVLIGATADEPRYILDTLGDLTCGLTGGFFGHFLASKSKYNYE